MKSLALKLLAQLKSSFEILEVELIDLDNTMKYSKTNVPGRIIVEYWN